MVFKKLGLKNFRNISQLTIEFSEGLNILVGQNGQGKTNILEALFLLSRGESFRYAKNQDFIFHKQSQSVIRALIENNGLTYDAKVIFNENKKEQILNDKKTSSHKISDIFTIVLFSPESLSAIKEGPDQRRDLVDDFLININGNNHKLIQDYKKALRMRNKVLKNHSEGITDKNTTLNILESLNPQFFKLATALTYQRIDGLKRLMPEMNIALQNITQQNVDISVEYVVSDQNIINFSSENISLLLMKRASELNTAELSYGSSLIGPHKHDISFLYNQKDSRIFCSQGQQRALILSFKMAQIVYHRKVRGSYPVLMLDDVLSELDEEKRKSLISFLNQIETQIFITTTDFILPDSLKQKNYSVLEVKEGNCVRASTN